MPLAGTFVLFVILVGGLFRGVAWNVPNRADAATHAANQQHVDTIRGLLKDAGVAVSAAGPWTPTLQDQFSAFLENAIQKQEHWGNPETFERDSEKGTRWPHVADGIWSPGYSDHLAKTIPAHPGPFADGVSKLRRAADALAEADILWTPSVFEGLVLSFLNGSLSGFADEIIIWFRYEDDPQGARRAHLDFKLLSRFVSDYSPWGVLITTILGAVLSVLAVFIGLLLIKFAPTPDAAFKVAFWVEILEGILFVFGQGLTTHEMPDPFRWLFGFVVSVVNEFSAEFWPNLETRLGLGVGGGLEASDASPWLEIVLIVGIACFVGFMEKIAHKRYHPQG
jgi:hypothetical protein